jgi:mannosyltransferase
MDAPGTDGVDVATSARPGPVADRPAPGRHRRLEAPAPTRPGDATRASTWPAPGLLTAAAVLAVAAGVILRFWTTSDLWLDEALTVNIASQPLSHLHRLLERDGAPPLYYVLLHVWMKAFGSSDLAVRSLSGVMSCATLPLAWIAGRRLGGRVVAASALVLLATSPFAVRYATENRMYALVVLLSAAGLVALQRAFVRPRPGNLIAIGASTALLLYSQYWALYLVGVTALWLAWQGWWGPERRRNPARRALLAVAAGAVLFVPWLPTFHYQSVHTGTPWAIPAGPGAVADAVSAFAGGPDSQGRALALTYFALVGLGMFGVATGALHIDLDLRTRPRARGLAVVLFGTLLVAVVGGYATRSAFQARYASVVLIPLVLLVALGFATFADRRIRAVVLAVAVILGLVGCVPNVWTNRTQAGQVAAVLHRQGRPGDVVAYCPDQLGPDTSRLLQGSGFREITFPRDTPPEFVNWTDYARATAAANPQTFATHVEQLAGSTHTIWLVWMSGYQTYGTKCEAIAASLSADRQVSAHVDVSPEAKNFYEPMELMSFAPTTG